MLLEVGNGRECSTNASVINDMPVAVKGYVKIAADENALSGEMVNVLNGMHRSELSFSRLLGFVAAFCFDAAC